MPCTPPGVPAPHCTRQPYPRGPMKRSREIPIPLLAAAALLVGGGAGAQSVTAVRSSIKVRPNTTPAPASSIELHAGKNELEAFQAVVLGGASGLSSVTAVAPTLKRDTDNPVTIPVTQIRLYREQTLYLSQPLNLD